MSQWIPACAFALAAAMLSHVGPAAHANGAAAPAVELAPTWSAEIAPIVYRHCAECHHAGGGAPFPLLSYDDAARKAGTIAAAVKDGTMPPWHPKQGAETFKDARRLSAADRDLILAWVAAGHPEGDRSKAPAPPVYASKWKLGEPDLILSMASPFTVPAEGPDIYRNFALPIHLPADVFVSAVDIRPSSEGVVHHVLFWIDDEGAAIAQEGSDGKPGFSGMGFKRTGGLGGWAVGMEPRRLPLGLGRSLKKETTLILATHFHPNGREQEEKMQVGLYFTPKPPDRSIFDFQIPPVFGRFSGIDIPAGDATWTLRDSFTLPADIDLLVTGGHAHMVCRSMDARATLPDGTVKDLLTIPRWRFAWQNRYEFQEPVRLPKGTRIDVAITYDNTAANEDNPFNPPRRITWGLESTDEMGSMIFTSVPVSENDLAALKDAQREKLRDAATKGTSRGRATRRGAAAGEPAPPVSTPQTPAAPPASTP